VFHDLKWSPSVKKIARRAFDTALESALAKVMAGFKQKANAASTPSEMWEIEDYLRQQRREIDETFDYRYSQLPLVFARLIREGRLDESLLSGLPEEKREIIRSFLAFARGDGGSRAPRLARWHEHSGTDREARYQQDRRAE
jgi:Photoprotection regulator fluorescence recovery protein